MHFSGEITDYLTILDEMPYSVLVVDNGVLVYSNKVSIGSFKASNAGDILGKSFAILSPDQQPDGRSSAIRAEQYFDQAFSGKEIIFEWMFHTLNLHQFWCKVTLKGIQFQGRSCVMATVIDIQPGISSQNYLNTSLQIISENLHRIAMGDTSFSVVVPEADTDTFEIREKFLVLAESLEEVKHAVKNLNDDTNLLSKAATQGMLDTRADASKHQGDFRKIVEGMNGTLDAVIGPLNIAAEYVDRISKGDIPPKITDSYNGDFNEIKNNLNQCIDAVNFLMSDIHLLSEAAVNGNLDTRADANKHQGEFKAIVEGVNTVLETFIHPLKGAAKYIGRIANGDIPQKITKSYNGDFNEIKNNLNTCIDAISLLISDAALLNDSSLKGALDIRADATKHQGDFRRIIEGVNGTLDAVIGPLNVAAEYVDRISKGDIPQKITDPYNGDFNEIKNNLNQCIDEFNFLMSDIHLLSEAAVNGDLDTRADATKHQGDFRTIVEGVNNVLETFIHPLKGAAKYIGRIANGDIPPKITKSYNGDFNEIKNNLNTCIDAINLLVSEANLLSDSAIQGILDTRGDTSKHQGDFRKIVEGVNLTLDHLVWPIREASRISKRYARCDFSARIDKNLDLSGEFGPFRDALNGIGIQMEEIITEINHVAGRYATGDFSAEIVTSVQVQGDLCPLRDALNLIGSDISDALKVVNNQMTDLTKQASRASSGVEDVSRGAELIAQNAETTRTNAELSQDGISQVLQTMEDLTRTISEVSINTDQVAQLTVTTDEIARQGVLHANEAELGMAGITRTSKTVHTLINEIQSDMQKIGKIVTLITDIANQTNLLALNAAIEAARAGEAGRGFAVVAAEVKSLAQDSRSSAGNISEMIAGLQTRSQMAADAMVEAESAVDTGNKALSGTLEAFQSLTQSVEIIKQKMEVVASASEEQAASFEEITASVGEMSHQVGETAKQALNSSATSEEALAIVEQIHEVIDEINTVTSTISKTMARFTTRG